MEFYAIIINIGSDQVIELIHFGTYNECKEYLQKFGLSPGEEYRISTLIQCGLFENFQLLSGDQHIYLDIVERSFNKRYLSKDMII